MIGPLFRRNFAHHARLLGVLAGGLALLELIVTKAAAQIEMGPGLATLLEQFVPPAARELLFTQFGLVSFPGAVAFGFEHPAVLVASVAWAVVAGTIPAAERESGLFDLILARPVSRAKYVLAVLLLIVLGAVVLSAALVAGAALGLSLVEVRGELAWTRYVLPAADLALLLLAIGGYTLAFACASPRRGPAIARAVGVTLAAFVVELLADLWEPLERVRWLSPFHYFKPVPAALEARTPWLHAAVLVGILAGGYLLALARFKRQDL